MTGIRCETFRPLVARFPRWYASAFVVWGVLTLTKPSHEFRSIRAACPRSKGTILHRSRFFSGDSNIRINAIEMCFRIDSDENRRGVQGDSGAGDEHRKYICIIGSSQNFRKDGAARRRSVRQVEESGVKARKRYCLDCRSRLSEVCRTIRARNRFA